MKILLTLLALLPGFAHAMKVDTKASKVTWEGRKLGGSHHGTLAVKSGDLEVAKGALTGGTVVIDMTSLKDEDLTAPEMNGKLTTHLKSDDFFSIEKNPTSTLKITKVEPKDGKTEITGDLTIKGITHPVTFLADVKADAKSVTAKGNFEVDRTLYDIKFRSLKFFANIGDKVIKDQFGIGFDLKAKK